MFVWYDYSTKFSTSDQDYSHQILGELWNLGSTSADVTTLNGGYVLYTGVSDYIGTFVVIEHGMGLRTVYGNLSYVSVSVGDFVVAGENIGRTGTFKNSDIEGVFIAAYIFDTPINYSNIAGKTLSFYKAPKK